MRQTNNALTFLSASYQAVFKHAYFAGLASSAVMLSLASPYALAGVDAEWDENHSVTNTDQDHQLKLSNEPFSINQEVIALSDAVEGGNTDPSISAGTSFDVYSGQVSGSGNYVYDNIKVEVAIPAPNDYPREEGLTVSAGANNTYFFAQKGIDITNGYLNASGSDTHIQYIETRAPSSTKVDGYLNTDGGSMDINRAVVNTNAAEIYNSYIEIEGQLNTNGGATSDLHANYSSINTGLAGSDTNIHRTNLHLGDHSAFNVQGNLTIGERTTINFKALKDPNDATPLNLKHGESFAKSQLQADNAQVTNTFIEAERNTTGAIYANRMDIGPSTSGSGSVISIREGADLQFATRYENQFLSNGSEVQTGAALSDSHWINTVFEDQGILNISGTTINNSGDVTFGATSITWTPNVGQPAHVSTIDYDVSVSGSEINNSATGTMHIGANIATVLGHLEAGNFGSTVDNTNGTTFTINDGTTFNNSGSVEVYENSQLAFSGGTLNNEGIVNINSGSQLNVENTVSFNMQSGSIVNNGDVSLTNAKLNIDGGTIQNAGNLKVDANSTLYLQRNAALNMQSGTISNLGNIELDAQAQANISGGIFQHEGNLQVNSGAVVNLVGQTEVIVNTSGSTSTKIAEGGKMVLTAGVLSNHSGDTYIDVPAATEFESAKLEELTKFNLENSGSLALSNGVFVAENNDFGNRLASALNAGEANEFGQIYINDATLMLAQGLNLDTSSDKLKQSKVAGSGKSNLYVQGALTFTESSSESGEDLNNFESITAQDITFKSNDPLDRQVDIKSAYNADRTFAATNSINAENGADINFEGFDVRLTSEQFFVKKEATQPPLDFSNEVNKKVTANLALSSGSSLDLEAGQWQAQDISAQQSSININGSVEVSGELISTNAGLDMQDLTLEDSTINITSGSGLQAQSVSMYGNSKLSGTSNTKLNLGDFLISGTSTALISNSPVEVDSLDINIDASALGEPPAGGLILDNPSSFTAQGDVNVNNGIFDVNHATTQQTDYATTPFDIEGKLALDNSARTHLNRIEGRIEQIQVNSSDALLEMNNAQLRTEGISSQGTVNIANSEISNYYKLNNQGSMSFDNTTLTNYGDINSDGTLVAQNGSSIKVTGGDFNINGSGSTSLNNSSLESDNIYVNDNGALTAQNSTITTESLHGASGSAINLSSGSNLNIKGDSSHSTVDIAGNINLDATYLNLGDALDTLAVTYDKTAGLQIGGGANWNNPSGTAPDFTPIQANNGSIIYVNLSGVPGSSGLTLAQLNDFAKQLMSGNGIIRVDGSLNPELSSTYNEEKNRYEVDHNDFSKFDDLNLSISTETTRESVLVNASGALAGEWKGIETVSGSTSFEVDNNKTLSILGQANAGTASGDALNIAQNAEGNVVGVNLGTNSALNLQANGNIGNILNQDLTATLNISGADSITIKATGGADGGDARSQIKVGKLLSDALINVQDVNVNKAVFNQGAGLIAENVDISDSLSANGSTFLAQDFRAQQTDASYSTFKATNLDTGNFSGSNNTLQATDIQAGNFSGSSNKIIADNNFNAQSFTGESNTLYANNINVTGNTNLVKSEVHGTSFNGTDLTLNESNMALYGDINAAGEVQVIGGSTLTAQNMTLGSGDLSIGSEGNGSNIPGTSGKVVLENLNLNGNDLFLDPDFGQKTATLFVKNIGDADSLASGSTVINGNVVIGRNSAMGIGENEQEFIKETAKHQELATQSFTEDGIGAFLYIDRNNIKLGEQKLLIGAEDIAFLKDKLANGSAKIYLGKQSGIFISSRALQEAQDNSNLIFSDLDSGDILESTDGTLFVPSFVREEDIADIFGDQIQLASGSSIKIESENGLISGVIDSSDDLHGTGDLELTISEDARAKLKEVSQPTYDYYMGVLSSITNNQTSNSQAGTSSDAQTDTDAQIDAEAQIETEAQIAATQTTQEAQAEQAAPSVIADTQSAGYAFLSQAGAEGEGRAIEQSARLASYGMGVQVTHQAAKATSDAISKRLSMNHGQNTAKKTNMLANEQAALWVSPTYQQFGSNNFKANDLSYGSDIDLYGLVAGFDYNLRNGMKIGGVVNFGQGDATGKGSAAGISNDFSYYGAGLFASVKPMRNFTLMADASFTKVQNDLETSAGIAGYNRITGTADSSAWSLGVGGQYQFKAAGFNIMPHAGVRYTNINMDGYDFNADGQIIGHTETDSANILSIPVGVAISTELMANNWYIQPYADLTVTANIGADSLSSATSFDGVVGTANYNTEFIDSFTYGMGAGLRIVNGNFSLGASVGYTGSSNTNEVTAELDANMHF